MSLVTEERVKRAARISKQHNLKKSSSNTQESMPALHSAVLGAFPREPYWISSAEAGVPGQRDIVGTNWAAGLRSDLAPLLSRGRSGGIQPLPATAVDESRLSVPYKTFGSVQPRGISGVVQNTARRGAKGENISLAANIGVHRPQSTGPIPKSNISLAHASRGESDEGESRLYRDVGQERRNEVLAQYIAWLGGPECSPSHLEAHYGSVASSAEDNSRRNAPSSGSWGECAFKYFSPQTHGILAAHQAFQFGRQVIEARRRRRALELGWELDLPFPPPTKERVPKWARETGIVTEDTPESTLLLAGGIQASPYPIN